MSSTSEMPPTAVESWKPSQVTPIPNKCESGAHSGYATTAAVSVRTLLGTGNQRPTHRPGQCSAHHLCTDLTPSLHRIRREFERHRRDSPTACSARWRTHATHHPTLSTSRPTGRCRLPPGPPRSWRPRAICLTGCVPSAARSTPQGGLAAPALPCRGVRIGAAASAPGVALDTADCATQAAVPASKVGLSEAANRNAKGEGEGEGDGEGEGHRER